MKIVLYDVMLTVIKYGCMIAMYYSKFLFI